MMSFRTFDGRLLKLSKKGNKTDKDFATTIIHIMANAPAVFAYVVVGIIVLGTISVISIIFTLIRLANARDANSQIRADTKPDVTATRCVTSINPDGSVAVATALKNC